MSSLPPPVQRLSALDRIVVNRAPAGAGTRQWSLDLYFRFVTNTEGDADSETPIPPGIIPGNIQISKVTGAVETELRVLTVTYPPPNLPNPLTVLLEDSRGDELNFGQGDLPSSVLRITEAPARYLAAGQGQAGFVLEKESSPAEDFMQPVSPKAIRETAVPDINYLARDYDALRDVMLSHIELLVPGWQAQDNPADMMVAVVEALAYAGDQLSYYQDAVATEGYLETARLRQSVRRHVRLVDYFLNEGCNARVWVHIQVASGVLLPAGTPLLTRWPGASSPVISPLNGTLLEQAIEQGAVVFETMDAVQLLPDLNQINFQSEENESQLVLPKGSTAAKLQGLCSLQPGDVLIFEEILSPATGRPEDSDLEHRHAVRLTTVEREETKGYTSIGWRSEDALPFSMPVNSVSEGLTVQNATVARGNIVLADHGYTLSNQLVDPALVPRDETFNPLLPVDQIASRELWDGVRARLKSAAQTIRQDPARAVPQVTLTSKLGLVVSTWTVRRDLLESNAFARHVVVEPDRNNRMRARFGDGTLGRRPAPGSVFSANVRVGNGPTGNVGAEAITQVMTDSQIALVRNPLPAAGGTAPQPVNEARLLAPAAFWLEQRAVTVEDYVRIAERHTDVSRAAATVECTGQACSFTLAIDRRGGKSLDPQFESELKAFINQFRLAADRVNLIDPTFVPLEIVLVAYAKGGSSANAVRNALRDRFTSGLQPDGRKGFFHPDHFTFGQPVYLSRILTTALTVPNVSWINSDAQSDPRIRFQRQGQARPQASNDDEIAIGPLEIARADSNPAAPDLGRVEFLVVMES